MKRLPWLITVGIVLAMFAVVAVGAHQCGRNQTLEIASAAPETPIVYGAADHKFDGLYRVEYYYRLRKFPMPFDGQYFIKALPLTIGARNTPTLGTVVAIDTIPKAFKNYSICLDCPYRVEVLRAPVLPEETAPQKPTAQ